MKIIIEVQGKISPTDALQYVKLVMERGKISDSRGIKHYCWASRYNDGTVVATRTKRNKNSADSFVVYKS